ncbi:MAG: glucose-1-phosphate cytidylyltransferase [Saprospiraceae bacterium]|nr:glucose-1-phosphate cytidylyltransferase [Saprospiraceae bacterium]
MKVVILAGGIGTRLMEETTSRPKPMVEIAGKPILWHIMKIYESQGFSEFIICLGYKGYMIKEYFLNYYLYNSDVTIELENNKVDVHYSNTEKFKVSLIDTGLNTNTAGRIKKIQPYVKGERFMLTYGDGVSNIDLVKLIKFHIQSKKIVTLSTVQSPGRFGQLEIDVEGTVGQFSEKPEEDGMWINAGYFVMEPDVFQFLNDDVDAVQWEKGPLLKIAESGQLGAYKHRGFWKCMDAMRDRIELEELWNSNKAEWKIW